MNRQERRRLDALHRKFVNSQQSYDPRLSEEHIRVKQKFLDDWKRKGEPPLTVFGALGESLGSNAYVEEIIRPEEGGVKLKLYGISYLLKGFHSSTKVHGLELAKSLISEIPRDIVARNPLLWPSALLLFLSKKRFIHALDQWFTVIQNRSMRWNELPDEEYNAPVRELRRAAFTVIERRYGMTWPQKDKLWDAVAALPEAKDIRYRKDQVGYLMLRMSRFICLMLELDTAYLLRIQDAFGTIPPKPGLEMLWCGLETLLSREVRGQGVAHKWRFIRLALKVFLWRVPEIRDFLSELMDEVDWQKVRMDEDDWYFCLKYVSYNFGGLDEETRFALRDELDKQRNHVFLIS